MQRTLPTEPGTYLFCGHRSRKENTVHHLSIHPPRTEMVRVYQREDGKVSYVGNDFFYHPEEVVGVWLKITAEAEAVQAEAQVILFDEAVRNEVPATIQTGWWATSRTSIVGRLTGPFPTVRPLAERAFDRAVELGLIVGDAKGAYTRPGDPK